MTSLPPPLIHAPRGDLPVLLSVPHSGRDYPDWLVGMARAGRASLTVLEDPLVDRLAWRALKRGIGAVIARVPRAMVDCNRAEDEVDPSVVEGASRRAVSARARGGLGIIPSRTPLHGYLWRRAIGPDELERRIAEAHRPYHEALRDGLDLLTCRFGSALLLDCHSMPPPPAGVPPIVFGDCHGRSADRWVAQEALRIARSHGFEAGLNDPFAGGHIIARHGRPTQGVQALQIEVDRRCYLDAEGEPGPEFDRVARLIEALAEGLGLGLLGRQAAIAAE